MLTADGAGGARIARDAPAGVERLAGNMLGFGEAPLLEVARRQGSETVECEQIGDSAELAVLRRCRPEGTLREILGCPDDAGGIGDFDAMGSGDCDGLQLLRAHDGAETAAAGVAIVVTD